MTTFDRVTLHRPCIAVAALFCSLVAVLGSRPADAQSLHPPMMVGQEGFTASALLTIGEEVNGYYPPQIPDGLGAFELDASTVRVLLNHEIADDSLTYAYELANGTVLKGARVSYLDLDRSTREIVAAGIAYDAAYDRRGEPVVDAVQINEGDAGTDNGFDRFCSAQGYAAGEYGFVDDIYFTHEETSVDRGHPHGGSVWAIDVTGREIWAAPALGRGSWENVAAVDTDSDGHIALLLGDDIDAAPLYLYVGEKDAVGDGSFLDRNGLASGSLFAWRSEDGESSPEDFNGTGSEIEGEFIPLEVIDPEMAGEPGYDDQGYLDDVTLRALATAEGAFLFSRPEDLHTNPDEGDEVVFSSTGAGDIFPSDNWGAVYLVEIEVEIEEGDDDDDGEEDGSSVEIEAEAELTILHDGDDYGDFGIRNSDNLVWAGDGLIYVQEDRSTEPAELFGAESGIEASVWQLDPESGDFTRVAVMDRTAVAPAGSFDRAPGDFGAWESSGIIDVSDLFDTEAGALLLMATVQAHTVIGGILFSEFLGQGGQVIFLESF